MRTERQPPGDDAQGRDSLSERQSRYRAGIRSEALTALAMLAKGYRVLDRRWRSPSGEIDLVVRRGRRLAFVEVKRRPDVTDEEAHQAVGGLQRERVRRAADLWLQRHPQHRECDIGFDLVVVAPWRWPRHIENGL